MERVQHYAAMEEILSQGNPVQFIVLGIRHTMKTSSRAPFRRKPEPRNV